MVIYLNIEDLKDYLKNIGNLSLYASISFMKTVLNKIFNLAKILSIAVILSLYILFCFFITAFLSISILTVGFALKNGVDWQIIIYLSYLALIIIGSWAVPWSLFFVKTKTTKIFVILVYLILFISYFYTYNLLPSVKKQYDLGKNVDLGLNWYKIDSCLDTGGCWDDIRNRCEMKDQGKCVESPEKCESIWKGTWDEENQYCIIE